MSEANDARASGTYVPHEVPELAQDAKHLMLTHQAHSALIMFSFSIKLCRKSGVSRENLVFEKFQHKKLCQFFDPIENPLKI